MQNTLETVDRILCKCLMFTLAILVFWFAIFMIPGNLYCNLQAQMFGITQQECALVSYSGMGFLKLGMWLLFFAPWLAVRMEIRRMRKS